MRRARVTHSANTPVDRNRSDDRLVQAAKGGAAADVVAALADGADCNAVDSQRRTSLQWAARHGDAASVRALRAAGSQADWHDGSGWTALMDASFYGRTEAARLLVAAGADACATVDLLTGRTAILLAAARGHAAVVEVLLAAGANGLNALQVACNNNDTATVLALMAHSTAAYTDFHWCKAEALATDPEMRALIGAARARAALHAAVRAPVSIDGTPARGRKM